jgi:hypothetical protein
VELGGVSLAADEAGRFGLEPPAGQHLLRIVAAGYIEESFAVTLPHRGELRGLAVHLCPFRLRVLEEFRLAAQPLLAGHAEFDVRTPRELAPRGGPALSELAALVEETSYSGRDPSSAVVETAKALGLRERNRRNPQDGA